MGESEATDMDQSEANDMDQSEASMTADVDHKEAPTGFNDDNIHMVDLAGTGDVEDMMDASGSIQDESICIMCLFCSSPGREKTPVTNNIQWKRA